MDNRMSSLPIVRFCSAAGKLGEKHGAGRAAAISSAFHANAAETDEAPALLARLTPEEREEIDTWYLPTDVTFPDGTNLVYAEAEREFETMLDRDGEWTDDPEKAVSIGHPDMRWIAHHKMDGRDVKICYIGDLKKTDFSSPDGVRSLQLIGYGFAEASRHDCDGFCVGYWNLTEGGWDWGEIIEIGFDSIGLLDQVMHAVMNTDGEYATGSHCQNCWERLHCQEYLLPIHDPEAALFPLSKPGGLTKDNALGILELVQRAKKLLPAAEAQLKAYAKENGGIPAGNGKVWRKRIGKGGNEVLDKGKLVKHMQAEHPEICRDFTYVAPPGADRGHHWCKEAKKETA